MSGHCVDCGEFSGLLFAKNANIKNTCYECIGKWAKVPQSNHPAQPGKCAKCAKTLEQVYGRTICKDCVKERKSEAFTERDLREFEQVIAAQDEEMMLENALFPWLDQPDYSDEY